MGVDDLAGLDVVFLALPHGESQGLAPALVGRVGLLVDLSADFRLRDATAYPRWYGHDHVAPGLLGEFVYGLPELFRSGLAGARLVAAPGCYPTAAALALAPLVRAGVIEPTGVIVDAASGVSGAGRKLSHTTQFNTADEDFTAYGLLDPPPHARDRAGVGGPGAVHATPRPHEPRDPGHVLRPARRGAAHR